MRKRLKRLLLETALLVLAAIIVINLCVRPLTPSPPHPLSPLHLRDKVVALAWLARHAVTNRLAGRDELAAPPLLREAARRHGVPLRLVEGVARTESELRSHSISRTGAMGIMQLMPDTATALGVADPFDPRENIDAGARFLRQLWQRYDGDAARVVAAYNAGPGAVPVSGPTELPDETRHYVHKVLAQASRR